MSLAIEFPLTERQAIACVAAAHQIGCEPWEVALSALAFKRSIQSRLIASNGWRLRGVLFDIPKNNSDSTNG